MSSAIRASHRWRSSWPLVASSTSNRFGPISPTVPCPTRSARVATPGSSVQIATAWHSAHGSAVVAAAITPRRITRSPRISAAASTTPAISAEHTRYGVASQLHRRLSTPEDYPGVAS